MNALIRVNVSLALVAVLVLVLFRTNPLGFTRDEVAKKLLFFLGFPLLLAAIVFLLSEAVVRRRQRRQELNELEERMNKAGRKAQLAYENNVKDLVELAEQGREALKKGNRKLARTRIEQIENVSER
jgi:phage shock protein A